MLLLPTDPHTFRSKTSYRILCQITGNRRVAYAVEVRRKKFNTSFGVMIKMVKGVKGIDPEKVKRV
jgi:hypothetical protein